MDLHGQFDGVNKCKDLKAEYDRTLTNYYIKYGDLHSQANAVDVYMKQKHRLIWQRRNPNKDNVGFGEAAEWQKKDEENLHIFNKDGSF